MRSILRVASLGVLALSLVTSAHASPRGRVLKSDYVSHGLFIAGHGNLVGQHRHMVVPEDTDPIVFQPEAGERSVEIKVDDRVAGWPLVYVEQAADHSSGHHHDLMVDFCATNRTLSLISQKPVHVWVLNGFCTNHTWGAATAGTVTATFNR